MAVYTREQLLGEAIKHGFQPSPRLFQDWVSNGLLARATSPGRGRGRAVGTWNETQRQLWLDLLAGRGRGISIPDLANGPVWVWYMEGSDAVPLRQVRKAMQTWAHSRGTATRRSARLTAERALAEFDHVEARPVDRKRLLDEVENAVWTGRVDRDEIIARAETLVRNATHDPIDAQFRFDPETVADLLYMHAYTLRAIRARPPQLPDELFERARLVHLGGMNWYRPRAVAAQADPGLAERMPLFDEAAESLQACYTLLTLLGLLIQAQTRPMPNIDTLINLAPAEAAHHTPT